MKPSYKERNGIEGERKDNLRKEDEEKKKKKQWNEKGNGKDKN